MMRLQKNHQHLIVMNTNDCKTNYFSNPHQLHRHRLAVTQKQLTQFWFSKTLKQLQSILSIKDQYLVCDIIFERYLKYYLNCKKIAPGEVYYVMHQSQIHMYVYDAKIFRSISFEKYDNDLISAFLIAFKSGEGPLNDDIFEFLDQNIVLKDQWIFKVKQSAILRIFPYLIHRLLGKKQSNYLSTNRNPIGGYFYSKQPNLPREVVILEQQNYYFYMYSILPKHHYSPQMSIKTLFDILIDLLFNNLLIAWYNELSEDQKHDRHFKRYFRLIPKPKNKQEFTSIQNRFTEIEWQTFKITAFKLKYHIKQKQNYYECYQIENQADEQLNDPYQGLDQDDVNILKAFFKQKQLSHCYEENYKTFFDTQLMELQFKFHP